MQVHPQQISPGENFDIFFFLKNHTDSATYYVRAVIYDVRTSEILATVPLTAASTNAHLFAATVQAPADPVGYGRNIVAIATLYTDSGYSTKSTDYEEQEQYFLIKPAPWMLGGGGVDYQALREIIEDVVGKKIKGIDFPEVDVPDAPDMSFVQRLFGALGALQREINRIPKETADFSGVHDRLDELHGRMGEVHTGLQDDIRSIEPPDLTPVNDAAGQMTGAIGPMRDELRKALAVFVSEYEKATQSYAKDALKIFEKVIREVATKNGVMLSISSQDSEPHLPKQQEAPDLSHLMS